MDETRDPLPERVEAHVFVCMLAYYVVWHMRTLGGYPAEVVRGATLWRWDLRGAVGGGG